MARKTFSPLPQPTDEDERLIDWASDRRLTIDINYLKGNIKLEDHKFTNVAAALVWATKFSEDWNLPSP